MSDINAALKEFASSLQEANAAITKFVESLKTVEGASGPDGEDSPAKPAARRGRPKKEEAAAAKKEAAAGEDAVEKTEGHPDYDRCVAALKELRDLDRSKFDGIMKKVGKKFQDLKGAEFTKVAGLAEAALEEIKAPSDNDAEDDDDPFA